MASLQNQQIDQTYAGLIKTNDEAALGATEKVIQDGAGNNSTLSMGTASASFTGTLDLSGATVTGDNNTTYDLDSIQVGANAAITLVGSDATTDTVTLVAGTNITLTDDGSANITIDAAGGGGAAGLVTNGANGMKSDSSLTTNPALSTGTGSIVLGDNAKDEGQADAIAIGVNARVRNTGGIAIGKSTETYQDSVAIGNGAAAVYPGVSIGKGATNVGSGNAVVIGTNLNTRGSSNIINIGGGTSFPSSDNNDNIVLGSTVTVASGLAERNIYIGNDIVASTAGVDDNVIIGHGATTNTGAGLVILGSGASATADGAVALGANVTAATANTATVNLFQIAGYASMNYADDTAAAAGGIPLGGVYHNAGALRIRIA